MFTFATPAHQAYWNVVTADPSTELAPYTANRIRVACASATPPRLIAPLSVVKVEPREGGGFLVHARRKPEEKKTDEDEDEHLTGEHRVPMPKTADDFSAEATEVTLVTPQSPVLCAGFEGSVRMGLAKDLFEWGALDANTAEDEETGDEDDSEEGGADEERQPPKPNATTTDPPVSATSSAATPIAATSSVAESEVNSDAKGEAKKNQGTSCADLAPLLNDFDESMKTPGLYLVGPGVQHEGMSFCFVYKFRQRFAIVAEHIARGLGYKVKQAVQSCFEMDMYMDDFTCCESACGETC